MAWAETAPGAFRKDFSGVENIYRKMSTAFSHIGKEHWGIHCIALRQAWKALMLEYPGLSVVPDNLTKVFVVPNDESAERWISQTFCVDSTRNADAIIAGSKPRDLPSLYYLPHTSEIVFLSQHWRTDAIGTCMLLDRLFSIVAQLRDLASSQGRPGLEKISPSLEDAAGAAEEGTPELQNFAREYIDNFHKKAINSGGLPYRGEAATPPAELTHQELTLTKDSTSALVAACKSRNSSVSAAIHTSLARTVFSFALPDDQPSEYTTVMATNMRAYLPPPYNEKTHACQTYVASITPTVQRSSDFATATAALTHEYRTWHSELFMQALREIYRYHAEKLFTPRPEGAAPPKPPSGVTLSSLGVIEKNLVGDYGDGAVQVDRFRFGVGMMTRQMLLYAWTFRGQLTLSVNYNSAYYEEEMAREVLSRITTTLEKELGLELGQIVL